MRDFVRGFVRGALISAVIYVAFMALQSIAVAVAAQAPATRPVVEVEAPALPVVPVAPEPAPAPAPAQDWQAEVRQDRVLAYSGGLLLEAISNATPAYTPGAAFVKQFTKQLGVQIQIGVLADADLVAHDPATAFVQGFLIGL